jgi:isopenicillin-N epimerase
VSKTETIQSWPTTPEAETYWETQTKQFMLGPGEVYLNTGSWGSLPRSVFESVTQSLADLEGNPTRNRTILLEKLRDSRESLACFLGAPAEDLAFLPIPASEPEEIVQAFREKMTPNTKLIVSSHIATRTGLIFPIDQLAVLAHQHGAMIAIDGAHAPGMIPLDLEKSGVDFYGGNCHKWLCAPKGTGFLYARPENQEKIQHLIVSWGYDKNGATRDTDGALKINNQPYMWQLEHWGTRDMAGFGAVGEAVAVQQRIGKDKIQQRGQQLAGYFRSQLADADWANLLTPSHPDMTGSITTFRYANFDYKRFGPRLYDEYRITTPVFNVEGGVLQRVSTHYYNSFEQLDLLIKILRTWQSET